MPSFQYFFVVLSKGGRLGYLNKRLDSIRLHRTSANPAVRRSSTKWYRSRRTSGRSCRRTRSTGRASPICSGTTPTRPSGTSISSRPNRLAALGRPDHRQRAGRSWANCKTASCGLICRPPWERREPSPPRIWPRCSIGGENGRPPRLVHPSPGAALSNKDHSAESIDNTGSDLIIERRVGRGRIVVSAFRITGPDFTSWEGCDSFFNACLMRRPARKFVQDGVTDVRIDWLRNDEGQMAASAAATVAAPGSQIAAIRNPPDAVITANINARQSYLDAKKCTSLRYFSRDAGQRRESYASDVLGPLLSAVDQFGNPIDDGPATTIPQSTPTTSWIGRP